MTLRARLAEAAASVCAAPMVALCKAHRRLDPDFGYAYYGHVLGLVPTAVGKHIRRAFYSRTLKRCGSNLSVEFGSYFVSPDTQVGDHFNCGAYCIVGRSTIGDYVMLASRCSVLAGLAQHGYDDKDVSKPMLFQMVDEGKVQIGRNVWIGEGAIVGVNVGENSIVGVGAVTTRAVRPGTVVLGNPARVVRHRGQAGKAKPKKTRPSERVRRLTAVG